MFLKGELKARTARRKKPSHNEDNLQIACVKWFGLQYPALAFLLIHPANGGSRKMLEAVRFKKMGVRAGVADLLLLVPDSDSPFLCLELKDGERGRQSREQKEWQKLVESVGAKYVVVRTIEQFISTIKNYLENR